MKGKIIELEVEKIDFKNFLYFHEEYGVGRVVRSSGSSSQIIGSFISGGYLSSDFYMPEHYHYLETSIHPLFKKDIKCLKKIVIEYEEKRRRKNWRVIPDTVDEKGPYNLVKKNAEISGVQEISRIVNHKLIGKDVEFELVKMITGETDISIYRKTYAKIRWQDKNSYTTEEVKDIVLEAMLHVTNKYKHKWVKEDKYETFLKEKNL
jgi:hypothetical protein